MASRFIEALAQGPLVFDGAMGTQLYERGGAPNRSFDEMSVSSPALVEAVHRDYLAAGVDVLQTNSYGANRFALQAHGYADRVREICTAAAACAKNAVDRHHRAADSADKKAFVAGAIGPTGLLPKDLMRGRTRRQIFDAFREQATALVDGGVDCLLFETFGFLGELEIAVESVYGLDVPVIAQARFGQSSLERGGKDDQTDDGAAPEEVVLRMAELGVDVVGANCCLGPEALLEVVGRMVTLHQEKRGAPVIFQPNAGQPRVVDGRTLFSSPETYGVVARRAFKLGVSAVGGCCGTGPEHLQRVVAAARMVSGRAQNTTTTKTSVSLRASGSPPVPFEDRSRLSGKLARGDFVVSVELSPPTGLDPEKTLAKVKQLEDGGVDAVNIPDGPRATVRMSNQALARIVVDRFSTIEPILHVCGRDRNLLALQADLIGAHISNIKNLVIITGDPPKVGDYPDATAVFDLDSIGLLGVADGLNRGLDPAGKPVGGQTRFVLMTGAEPAAIDVDRELARLKEKQEAGAELVMTQPVFDAETLDKFLTRVKPWGLRVVVGILPLASSRNAEFLHHNVPGMRLPDDVRARMKAAGEGKEAAREGVALAAEALRDIRKAHGAQIAGAYIMPPFSRVELALEVLAKL